MGVPVAGRYAEACCTMESPATTTALPCATLMCNTDGVRADGACPFVVMGPAGLADIGSPRLARNQKDGSGNLVGPTTMKNYRGRTFGIGSDVRHGDLDAR